MKYKKYYDGIIEKSKKENRVKRKGIYYEEHHILPKCMGGKTKKSNLVLLTSREHFLCHWLLTKIYPDYKKLVFAFNSFCLVNEFMPIGRKSKYYEIARKKVSDYLKQNYNENFIHSCKNKIWIKKDGKCIRIFENEIEKYILDGWIRGRIIDKRRSPTQETKNKIASSNIGRKATDEEKKKISDSSKGRVWIRNGKIHKMIKENELDSYLNEGWMKGRVIKYLQRI